MGAAMLIEFSCVVLSCSTFSRSTIFTEVLPINPEVSPIPLFKTILYSVSWIRKLVETWDFIVVVIVIVVDGGGGGAWVWGGGERERQADINTLWQFKRGNFVVIIVVVVVYMSH